MNGQIKVNIVGAVRFVLMYYVCFTGNFTINKSSCGYKRAVFRGENKRLSLRVCQNVNMRYHVGQQIFKL